VPKRIGYIMKQVLTLDNCTAAVIEGTANLERTPKIRRIRKDPEAYGQKILDILTAGWTPEPVREKTINESSSHKTRSLRIPSTRDHLIHVAIMRPILKELEKRYDFYSCGSIPGRGSKRVIQTIETWMAGDKPYNYAAEADVHHAYHSTEGDIVMACLRRFIKDEEYLHLHELILNQMGWVLAIGFQPSHWYFNMVMTTVDRAVRENFGKKVKFVRYMDNYVMASNRKRTLHKAVRLIMDRCANMRLSINHQWQVFKTKARPITALSYRFFRGYTILKKSTMYSIVRTFKKTAKKMCAHLCRAAMSKIGILRHCDSYHFRQRFLYHKLPIKRMKELISRADKKRLLLGTA